MFSCYRSHCRMIRTYSNDKCIPLLWDMYISDCINDLLLTTNECSYRQKRPSCKKQLPLSQSVRENKVLLCWNIWDQAISLLQLLCMLINYIFLPYTVTTIFVLNKVPSSSSISSVCSRTSTTNLSKLGHSIKGNNSM